MGMIYQTNFRTTGKGWNYCSHASSAIQWQKSGSWKSDIIGTSPHYETEKNDRTYDCGKTEKFLKCQCWVSAILQPYQTPGK